MALSKLLGIAGAAIVFVALFLPFGSVMGMSISLFKASMAKAAVMLVLGSGGGALSFKGGKTMHIIGLVLGALGLILAFVWMSDLNSNPFTKAGLGVYLMLVGSLLSAVAGVMGLMKK